MKKKKDMEIIDNFLDQDKFDELQKLILPSGDQPGHFAWYYSDGIDHKLKEGNKFQFVHMFYTNSAPNSSFCDNLAHILNKLKPKAIISIKANLLTRTPEIIQNAFHVDLGRTDMYVKYCTTSIFYVNTNNGYTKFEDGTIVESVANRLVTFPANLMHTGTTCSDEKIRVVINFDYFHARSSND